MAGINKRPRNLTNQEVIWYTRCPKSVLFSIAQYLALRISGADDVEDYDCAFAIMQEEWLRLHQNGIVPQKPVLITVNKDDL